MTRTPPGGPATINGVLYQMLWSLLRAVRLHVGDPAVGSSGQITCATLRLEPAGGGGDLVEIGRGAVIVEQLKARSTGAPWSLREVVEGVLPDLFMAVDLSGPPTHYRFITESRIGDWRDALRFFQSLNESACPETGLLEALDDNEEIRFRRGSANRARSGDTPFWSQEHYTRRELFRRIAEVLANRPAIRDSNTDDMIHRKLWHLLANFQVAGEQTESELRRNVDLLLSDLGVADDLIARTRDAMLTDLARRAARGNVEITAREFLNDHALDAVPFTHWETLASRCQENLDRALAPRGYDEQQEVRRRFAEGLISQWSPATPILVLSGESGQGKSWTLGTGSLVIAKQGQLAIFIEASGDADTDIKRVERIFWEDIKGNDTALSLNRTADRRRKLLPGIGDPWITLFVDGVQDMTEARELALRPWEAWGVRMAITCLPHVAEKIRADARNRCVVVKLSDFSHTELQEYCGTHLGQGWTEIPDDVRDTLRRPLLARLYCELSQGSAWTPSNEYELYARTWDRLYQGDQFAHQDDAVGLKRLALSLLEGGTYPWTTEQALQAGLDGAALNRLCRVGWLRPAPHHRFEAWHDRLLNWAVAQGLVASLQSGQLDALSLCARLVDLYAQDETFGGRHLGYVPMDVVWALADRQLGLADILHQVVEALENVQSWDLRESLYAHLLPTIGPRILDVLFKRLEAIANTDDLPLLNRIVEAITSCDAEIVVPRAIRMLDYSSAFAQRAAMRVLQTRPSARALDRLWELHSAAQSDPQSYLREGEHRYAAYEDSFGALRSCVPLDANWLGQTIEEAHPNTEPMESLAYLLATLDESADLWREHKDALFRKVRPQKERCLAINIGKYRDAEKVDWLLDRIDREDDLLGACALRALGRIDPDRAVQELHRLPPRHLYTTRGWCLRELLDKRPQAVLDQAFRMLQVQPNPLDAAMVFQGNENAVDPRTLDFLLDSVEHILDRELSEPTPPDRAAPLYLPLTMLAEMNRLELQAVFERRRGASLEQKLSQWLMALGPRSSLSPDRLEREPGVAVLCKIGRSGFTQVVNSHLEADNQYRRLDGIRLAPKRPDEDTIRLLARITQQEGLWDGRHPAEQGWATEALAGIGRFDLVVKSVQRWGLRTHTKVHDLALEHGRLSDCAIDLAFRALDSQGEELAGAVMAVGIGGRSEKASDLRGILGRVSPESDVALACTISLGLLRDDASATLDLLEVQLGIETHRYAARLALLGIGTDAALDSLLDHLSTTYDNRFVITLLRPVHTAGRALDLIREQLRRASPAMREHLLIESIGLVEDDQTLRAFLDDADLQEILHEVAFRTEGSSWLVGSKAAAIRGLGIFNPESALQAALTALQNPQAHDREYYPYLIMEISPDNGAKHLLEQAVTEESTGAVRAIGRALQGLDMESLLERWLASPNVRERLAACRLAGFSDTPGAIVQLLTTCLDDLNGHVVEAAREGLDRVRDREETQRLTEAFRSEQDLSRRWVLLDSLLALGDPGDKHRPWPDWAQAVAKESSYFMRLHMGEQLKKQRDKSAKEASDADNRRKR